MRTSGGTRRGARGGDGERGGKDEVVRLEFVVSIHRMLLPVENGVGPISLEFDVNELPAVDEGAGSEDAFFDYLEAGRDVFKIEERKEFVVV